jgi:hypothetical protein
MTWVPSTSGPACAPDTPHKLTHSEMRGPEGPGLTPACTCGWYSPNREHADFERHLRKVAGL